MRTHRHRWFQRHQLFERLDEVDAVEERFCHTVRASCSLASRVAWAVTTVVKGTVPARYSLRAISTAWRSA